MRKFMHKYRSVTSRRAGMSQFKQPAPGFFDLNSGETFFSGQSFGTRVNRKNDRENKEQENNQLSRYSISKIIMLPGMSQPI